MGSEEFRRNLFDLEVDEWTLQLHVLADFTPNNREDLKVWKVESNGVFSMRSLIPKLVNQNALNPKGELCNS